MAVVNKPFASGKHALGLCDRCGLTFKLLALKEERYKRRPTGLLVCDACFDPEHPQTFLGENVPVDAEALRRPRPDRDVDATRELTGTLVYPPVNGAE